jgi:hypothetical protein
VNKLMCHALSSAVLSFIFARDVADTSLRLHGKALVTVMRLTLLLVYQYIRYNVHPFFTNDVISWKKGYIRH